MDLCFKFANKEYVLPFTQPKGGRWYSLSMDVMVKDNCLWVENVWSKERESGQKIDVGRLECQD